jgi:8-oxo-dGTP diphosphatase
MAGAFRRRVSVVVVNENRVLVFRAEDPTTRRQYLFVPGGRIETGETLEQAAVRETFEETGYRVACIKGLSIDRRYEFTWDAEVYDCHTTYFAAELLADEPEAVHDAPYNQGAQWVPVDALSDVLGYHVDILEPVVSIVHSLTEKMP